VELENGLLIRENNDVNLVSPSVLGALIGWEITVESLQLFATPFHEDTSQPFASGLGSSWASITSDILEPILIMHAATLYE